MQLRELRGGSGVNWALSRQLHAVHLQALRDAGLTEKEAKSALEYYLHPAVADPSVQQAVTSVKVACAPTMYGEKKSLEILADALSEDAVSSVAPVSFMACWPVAAWHQLTESHTQKLLQMGAAAMQRMGNPQMVGQQLTQVYVIQSPLRPVWRAFRDIPITLCLSAAPKACGTSGWSGSTAAAYKASSATSKH